MRGKRGGGNEGRLVGRGYIGMVRKGGRGIFCVLRGGVVFCTFIEGVDRGLDGFCI